MRGRQILFDCAPLDLISYSPEVYPILKDNPPPQESGAYAAWSRYFIARSANEIPKSSVDISRNGDEDRDWILLEGKMDPEIVYIGGTCTSCGKFISIMQMNIELTASRTILKERLAQLGWTEEEGTCECGSKTVFRPNTMHIGGPVEPLF